MKVVTAPAKKIQVHYYAILREERGVSAEAVTTTARSPRELYALLQNQHGFSLTTERLQVAVNDAFASWDQPLQENDRVVFIPPVAGG